MNPEQVEEKFALAIMISEKDFDYKDALIRMIYRYKYSSGANKINDISYSETDEGIEIRIGNCYVKEVTSKIDEATYVRLYDSFVNFLISNTVKS